MSGYPAVWATLTALNLTPFELAAYLITVIAYFKSSGGTK